MTLQQTIFHWIRRLALASFLCGVVVGMVLTIFLWNLTWGG